MRLHAIISMTTVLFSGGVLAQGWLEYIDQSSFFSVNFPAEPVVREISHESTQGLIFPAQVYRSEGIRGDSYLVTVVDYTDAEAAHRERLDSTEAPDSPMSWLWDVRSSVAQAAWNLRKRGGEVTYDAWSDIERVEGHQLQITNLDGSRMFAGIYLHELRLYILEATVPMGLPPPGLFQQSLRFLDEGGKRVRYNLTSNGNITRIPGSYEYVGGDAEIVERSTE